MKLVALGPSSCSFKRTNWIAWRKSFGLAVVYALLALLNLFEAITSKPPELELGFAGSSEAYLKNCGPSRESQNTFATTLQTYTPITRYPGTDRSGTVYAQTPTCYT